VVRPGFSGAAKLYLAIVTFCIEFPEGEVGAMRNMEGDGGGVDDDSGSRKKVGTNREGVVNAGEGG